MKLTLYDKLSRQPAAIEVRWAGAEAMEGWLNRENYAAISVLVDEEKTEESVEKYSTSLGIHGAPSFSDFRTREIDTNGPGFSRFSLTRLLLREWAKLLHSDRINIFLSDEPRQRSRVRSYKGLIASNCRTRAMSFDQHEIEIDPQLSVIYNKIQLDSAAQTSCLIPLGDTFKAFGVYAESESSDAILARVASCYEQQQHLWQWESSRLLPVVCTNLASLFFSSRCCKRNEITNDHLLAD